MGPSSKMGETFKCNIFFFLFLLQAQNVISPIPSSPQLVQIQEGEGELEVSGEQFT